MPTEGVSTAIAWTALAAGATAVAAGWLGYRRWNVETAEMRRRLLAAAGAPAATAHSNAGLAGLPAPVARYLRTVLREGQPSPRRVRVTWAGEFNMGQAGADKWVPFTAVQDFVPGAPGFVWDARMAMAPGLTVSVRDSFVGGRGAMRGTLLGLFTIVDKQDDGALAEAALQRYLGEAIWLPTALLPGAGVRWEPLDDRRARATISGGGASAALEFRFGPDDLVESVYAAERRFDDGKHPPSQHPWQARVQRYGDLGGVKVPVDATVEWLLPGGAYAYWRGQPVQIVYDPAD